MRVRIAAAGREVELDVVDTNTTPEAVAALALVLWRAADGSRRMESFGLVDTEAAPDRTPTTTMGRIGVIE